MFDTLIPHDFTDARYLLPALRAYCRKRNADEQRQGAGRHAYRVTGDGEEAWADVGEEGLIGDSHSPGHVFRSAKTEGEALRAALHAALTEGVAE